MNVNDQRYFVLSWWVDIHVIFHIQHGSNLPEVINSLTLIKLNWKLT